MAGLPNHIHISEREPDGTWEDCTWDAGLEFYRDCFDPDVPATHAEAQALRKASGEPTTGGSNLGDFRKGVKERYGVTLPLPISAKRILDQLKPGMAAVVQGSMGAFGPIHPLSKWQRDFDGAHAVYIANVGGRLRWCDPLAPKAAGVPVTVSETDVSKFVNQFSGEAIVGTVIQPVEEIEMLPLNTTLLDYDARVKPNSNIRVEPRINSTLVRTTGLTAESVHDLVGTVHGDVDPKNGSDIWYAWVESGQWRFTAEDNIRSFTAPVGDDGFTKETQDAAVKAAVEAQKALDQAAIDKATSELATAAATERERIAVALGQEESDRVRATAP